MMTKANKILLIIGILLVVFAFFISRIEISSILIPIGAICIVLALLVRKNIKVLNFEGTVKKNFILLLFSL